MIPRTVPGTRLMVGAFLKKKGAFSEDAAIPLGLHLADEIGMGRDQVSNAVHAMFTRGHIEKCGKVRGTRTFKYCFTEEGKDWFETEANRYIELCAGAI